VPARYTRHTLHLSVPARYTHHTLHHSVPARYTRHTLHHSVPARYTVVTLAVCSVRLLWPTRRFYLLQVTFRCWSTMQCIWRYGAGQHAVYVTFWHWSTCSVCDVSMLVNVQCMWRFGTSQHAVYVTFWCWSTCSVCDVLALVNMQCMCVCVCETSSSCWTCTSSELLLRRTMSRVTTVRRRRRRCPSWRTPVLVSVLVSSQLMPTCNLLV